MCSPLADSFLRSSAQFFKYTVFTLWGKLLYVIQKKVTEPTYNMNWLHLEFSRSCVHLDFFYHPAL